VLKRTDNVRKNWNHRLVNKLFSTTLTCHLQRHHGESHALHNCSCINYFVATWRGKYKYDGRIYPHIARDRSDNDTFTPHWWRTHLNP